MDKRKKYKAMRIYKRMVRINKNTVGNPKLAWFFNLFITELNTTLVIGKITGTLYMNSKIDVEEYRKLDDIACGRKLISEFDKALQTAKLKTNKKRFRFVTHQDMHDLIVRRVNKGKINLLKDKKKIRNKIVKEKYFRYNFEDIVVLDSKDIKKLLEKLVRYKMVIQLVK